MQLDSKVLGRYCIPKEPINKKLVEDDLNQWRNIL